MFGCSRVIAHSRMGRFEQTGISIDAQGRRDVRKQRQIKTVNIGITHVFSCINICRVPRMLFELEADIV